VIVITLYSRPGCHLCDDMKAIVGAVIRTSPDLPASLEEIDVSNDPALESLYGVEIPVLMIDGKKAAKYRITEEALRRLLDARCRGTEPAANAG
jgi:glutaredoxin